MIQISFEPAFDPYHTAFRFLQQATYHKGPLSFERAKVFDIFLLEPMRTLEIRVPNKLKKKAKTAATCQRPVYGKRPSTQSLFNRMKPIHDAATQTLVLKGYFSQSDFENGVISAGPLSTPDSIARRIAVVNEQQAPLLGFLHEDLSEFPFDGINGIKDRTKLGEFKYDVA